LLLSADELSGGGVDELEPEVRSAATEGVEITLPTESFVLGLGPGEIGLAVFHEAVVQVCELVSGGGADGS
jgi:hypothetical protein